MSAGLQTINPNADVIGAQHALAMNIQAARGLQNVVKTNLGPKGTIKMLVGGAGQIKLTKDGKVLLDEMQIQHPTAAIIARTATAQDDITGDGTTSNVLFTGELLHQSARYLEEGLHPRVLVEGIERARDLTLEFLEEFKVPLATVTREMLVQVARTSLRTKLHFELADHLTEIIVDAVNVVRVPGQQIDLHMVEIMHMMHQTALDTKFINGLVLDHGARHPNMAKRSENCFILILNVSLEYEKSEINAGQFYKTAEERTKLAFAERKFTDDKVREIIAFKNSVCTGDNENAGFIVINQKGIDPISLDLLQKAGVVGIRRAKRRNMERLAKACGGYCVNALDGISADCLGHADLVYEHVLGEDAFTFVEGCKNATSCTILVRGQNDYTIRQILDAIRDGLRAVVNVIEDASAVPGAGAFEIAASIHLAKAKSSVEGRAKLGVQAFADALLVIPKTLCANSGLDVQSTLLAVLEEASKGSPVGVDLDTGKPMLPSKVGVWDNHRVKKQLLHLGTMIAVKLLLVDEVMRAGKKMK
jgi:T-complex protein 1 subunit zeta